MNISFSFFVVIILILFPGLLYRRLYYYGEFSKEFKAGYNLAGLLAISTIPGLLILVLTFGAYNYYFDTIDIGEVIDKFKDLTNPEFRLTESEDTPINQLLNYKAAPFLGFLYVTSTLLGTLSGRLIRISGLDTKFKLLRFKNYWFYLLNGQQFDFKKLKHLKEKNKKHVFTKADVLIDSNNRTLLYSGIVVDYELNPDDCTSLSKIMLQNASRYTLRNEKKVPQEIPGTILVVDCTSLKNLNLTYVYEEGENILKSRLPSLLELWIGILTIVLIPIFIFKSESIEWELYNNYFSLRWYSKLIAFFIVIQFIGLFNPFVKNNNEFQIQSWKLFFGKLAWFTILLFVLWLTF